MNLSLLLLLFLVPGAIGAFQSGQCADFPIGQTNSLTNTANWGGVSASSLSGPERVWTDGQRVIVLDSGNHRILIFNRPPNSRGASADVVLGQPDFRAASPNNGGLSARGFNLPLGVFSDGIRLFVADTHNHRVLVYFSIPNSHFTPADLVLGQPDFQSHAPNRGGQPGSETLHLPMDVHYDGKRLYVADKENNRVLIWNGLPAFNGQAASVVIGHPAMNLGAPNDGGLFAESLLAGPSRQGLHFPHALGVHQGRLYVSDSANNRILIYAKPPAANHAGADIVIGQENFESGHAGTGPMRLSNPRTLSFDGERMAVADYWNHRVLIYSSLPLTHSASADLVLGQPDFSSSGSNQGGVSACAFDRVTGVSLAGKRLYASDNWNNRVLVFEEKLSPTPTPIPRSK